MALFHYTLRQNWRSINEHGLLSWKQLHARGIAYKSLSNDLSKQLDSNKGLANYIRLTDIDDFSMPMLLCALRNRRCHQVDIVRLEFKDVFHWSNVLYSNRNATANDAKINDDPKTFLLSNGKA